MRQGIPVVRYGKQFRVPRHRLEEQLGGPITWPPPPSAQAAAAVDVAVEQPTPAPTERRGGRAVSQLSLAIES